MIVSTGGMSLLSLHSILDPFALFLFLCSVFCVYLVAKAIRWLFPGQVGQNIPRVALCDLFNLRSFRLRSLQEIYKISRQRCEKLGYKIVENPRDPAFFIWDATFLEEVINHPNMFPAYLIPDEEAKGNALHTRFMHGDLAQWKAIRGVVKPLMSQTWSPSFFRRAVKKLLQNIENAQGSPFQFFRIAKRSTSEVIYEVIFGVEPSADYFEPQNEGGLFLDRMDFIVDVASNILTWTGLGILFKSYRKQTITFHQNIQTLCVYVDDKRKQLVNNITGYVHDDSAELFPRLLKASEEGQIPKNSVPFDVAFLFFAGQGTSATLVVLALFYVASNPALQEQARTEINEFIPGEMPETASDLAQLKLCQAILDESLRLVPPSALTVGRLIPEPTKIGPKGIMPAGSIFNFFLPVIHRDPNYFDNPEKFDPHRWLTDDTEKLSKMKKVYRPFGFGPPACPGQRIARSQSLTVFVAIIKNFKVRISPEMKIEDIDNPFPYTTAMLPDVTRAIYEFEKL